MLERTFASWSETDFIDAVASCPTLVDAQAQFRRSPKSEFGASLTCSSNRRSALRQQQPAAQAILARLGHAYRLVEWSACRR
jgi:hypothetical protein